MKYLLIIGLWLMAFICDGIILPALTGLVSGFGVIVFLAILIVMFGVHRWTILTGIILASATEILTGAYFGTIIVAWLIMNLVWYFLNMFLNIKLINPNDSFIKILTLIPYGLGLFILGESVMWLMIRLIYETQISIIMLSSILGSLVVYSIFMAEFLVIIFILRYIYHSKFFNHV